MERLLSSFMSSISPRSSLKMSCGAGTGQGGKALLSLFLLMLEEAVLTGPDGIPQLRLLFLGAEGHALTLVVVTLAYTHCLHPGKYSLLSLQPP